MNMRKSEFAGTDNLKNNIYSLAQIGMDHEVYTTESIVPTKLQSTEQSDDCD